MEIKISLLVVTESVKQGRIYYESLACNILKINTTSDYPDPVFY